MIFQVHFLIFQYAFIYLVAVHGWQSEDLELFDLVEEVKQNFYEVFGVEQDASASDIRKAYRRLSIQHHPDKNKEPGAEETFRKIAAIADILRNEERRKKYNLILQNGLPDWRQPVFYYRHVRKMGLWELTIFLLTLITFGQYLILWSAYWEKKYELEEVLTSRFRKKDKRTKKVKQNESEEESLIAEHINQLPKPRYQDLLPIRLVYFIIDFVKSAPEYYQNWRESAFQEEEDEEILENDDQNKVRKPRKKYKVDYPDYSGLLQPVDETLNETVENEENFEKQSTNKNNLKETKCTQWTDLQLNALGKAMKKFPGGTVNRWEKIAEAMNSTVTDVTAMAKQLKSSLARQVPTSLQGLTGTDNANSEECKSYENSEIEMNNLLNNQVRKQDTKPTKDSSNLICSKTYSIMDDSWSQQQQKSLELALQQFQKGAEDRWDKIAECVPGKTKEECIYRYKVLVEVVKKKKSAKLSQ